MGRAYGREPPRDGAASLDEGAAARREREERARAQAQSARRRGGARELAQCREGVDAVACVVTDG